MRGGAFTVLHAPVARHARSVTPVRNSSRSDGCRSMLCVGGLMQQQASSGRVLCFACGRRRFLPLACCAIAAAACLLWPSHSRARVPLVCCCVLVCALWRECRDVGCAGWTVSAALELCEAGRAVQAKQQLQPVHASPSFSAHRHRQWVAHASACGSLARTHSTPSIVCHCLTRSSAAATDSVSEGCE